MTLPPDILDAMIDTLDWMIRYFKWSHEQADLGGTYSPELQKAMNLLDLLKRIKQESEDGQH